jgi:hypothetical protein
VSRIITVSATILMIALTCLFFVDIPAVKGVSIIIVSMYLICAAMIVNVYLFEQINSKNLFEQINNTGKESK